MGRASSPWYRRIWQLSLIPRLGTGRWWGLPLRALLGIAVMYALILATMFLMQRSLLYPAPSPHHFDAQRQRWADQRRLLRCADGVVIEYWMPSADTIAAHNGRALLYCGGNGEDGIAARDRLQRHVPDPVIVWNYRGYGMSGGVPSEAAIKADAVRLVDILASEHAIAPENLQLFGRSLGTGVVLHIARHRAVGDIVLVTPYDSILAVASTHYPFMPIAWLLEDQWRSDHDAAHINSRVCIIAADYDGVIPPQHAEALAAALPRAPVQLRVPRSHNDVLFSANAWATIAGFYAASRP